MDPISDFLNTLKMASRTGKESFSFPFSRLILAIADALAKKGYIESAKKAKKGHTFEIKLPTGPEALSVSAVKRVSRLSKRLYRKAHEIRPVRNGSGLALISTPRGILSDKEARTQNVGGEVLFEIW